MRTYGTRILYIRKLLKNTVSIIVITASSKLERQP
jgi:hypothetical protein